MLCEKVACFILPAFISRNFEVPPSVGWESSVSFVRVPRLNSPGSGNFG